MDTVPADAAPVDFAVRPGAGRHQLLVGGQDVTRLVSRATVDVRAGDLPQVYLELARSASVEDFEGEGIVHTVREVPEDPAAACLRFLEPIDPEELDKAVLSSMEMGGPQTYGEACLAVMRAWARGD
jgi:hypothetical protein